MRQKSIIWKFILTFLSLFIDVLVPSPDNPLAFQMLAKGASYDSFVRNGLGFGLTTLGILWLLVLHHVNLRTIKEPPKTTRYPYMPFSLLKLTIFSIFVIIFLAITVLLSFLFTWNIYVL